MRHGNHGPQKEGRSVNWSDVAACVAALEAEYGGLVKIWLDRDGVKGSLNAIWVRVGLYRGWSDVGERPTDVCCALWPTNANRTMAGLCYRLLHQLDHAAASRRVAESEDIPF